MRTVLLDGDVYLFQAASAVQQECDWGDGVWSTHASLPDACDKFLEDTNAVRKYFDCDRMVVALSDPSGRYFRHDIFPSYKEKRRNTRKPILYNALRKWCEEEYHTLTKPGLEADDVLGVMATRNTGPSWGEKIIVSPDKDMGTIPGMWSVGAGDKAMPVSEWDAVKAHMKQTLTGDTVDCYPGCPGVGPVKAQRILDEDGDEYDLWLNVVMAFEKAGLTEEDALVQARLARILTTSDYNYDKEEPILWTAPTTK